MTQSQASTSSPKGLTLRRLVSGEMTLLGKPPPVAVIPTSVVNRAVTEGWAELDTPTMTQAPFIVGDGSYLFTEAQAITFNFAPDRTVVYEVTQQPGIHDQEVHWYYVADLVEDTYG